MIRNPTSGFNSIARLSRDALIASSWVGSHAVADSVYRKGSTSADHPTISSVRQNAMVAHPALRQLSAVSEALVQCNPSVGNYVDILGWLAFQEQPVAFCHANS